MNRNFLLTGKTIYFTKRAGSRRSALIANRDRDAVSLIWSAPDDGGSPITDHRLYHGVEGGAEVLLVSPGPDVTAHSDNDAAGASYNYRAAASNGNGLGASSARLVPSIPDSACTGVGITVLTDVSGNALTRHASHDIRSVHITSRSSPTAQTASPSLSRWVT